MAPTTFDEREKLLHDLLQRGMAGDAAAYKQFLQALGAHLRGYYRKRLFGWPDDGEDLVQECLLAVHNKRHTYLPGQPLTAWVHAIARYKFIDLLRARSSREALHDPLDNSSVLQAEPVHEAHEARTDLMELLQHLPERQRRPIELVKIAGLSVAEAAQQTGMTASAIKVGVHRGLKALATQLALRREKNHEDR